MAKDVYEEWTKDDPDVAEELDDLETAENRKDGPDPDPNEPSEPEPAPQPCEPDPEPCDPYTQNTKAKAAEKVEFRIVGRSAKDDTGADVDGDDEVDEEDDDTADSDETDAKSSERKGKTKIEDKGIIFKTSGRAYFWNYVLVILLFALLVMAWPVLHLTFSLSPQSFDQLWKSGVVLVFIVLVAVLLNEPFVENTVRHYVISNTEIMKVEGIISKDRIIIPYQAVSDVVFHKGIMGRILNFGDIEVTGFNNRIMIKGVVAPETVYRIIQNKISMARGGRNADKRTVFVETKPDRSAPARKAGWRDKSKDVGDKLAKKKRK